MVQDHTHPPSTVLIVDPVPARVQSLSGHDARLRKAVSFAICTNIADAFVQTQKQHPHMVLISNCFLSDRDFPAYQALLGSQWVKWHIIMDDPAQEISSEFLGRALVVGQSTDFETAVHRVVSPLIDRAQSASVEKKRKSDPRADLVVIGASTGGVEALGEILGALPSDCPPILVVQHMGPGFMHSFVQRLNNLCAPRVIEACDGMQISSGNVIIAPDKMAHLTICTRSMTCKLEVGERVSGHQPSIDVLFRSAVRFAPRLLAIILTGMGRDGAEGMLQIRQAGGMTIAQDQATCVVYGMPRAAKEIGAVQRQLPVGQIGQTINDIYAPNQQGHLK